MSQTKIEANYRDNNALSVSKPADMVLQDTPLGFASVLLS
jgi:hypothetical protein